MQFQAQPQLAGKTVACPSCGGRLTVPAAAGALAARSVPDGSRFATGPAVSAPVASAQVVACECGARFQAGAQLAGKTVRCPTCQRPLRIPLPRAAGRPASAAAPQPADGFWDALLPENSKPVAEEPPAPAAEEPMTSPQATAFAIQQLSRGLSPNAVRRELAERGVSEAEASRVVETLAPTAKTASRTSGRSGGLKNMLIGGIVCFIGLAVTVGSYVAAEPGGVFLLAYGPIIFGGIQFLRGFFQLCVGSD